MSRPQKPPSTFQLSERLAEEEISRLREQLKAEQDKIQRVQRENQLNMQKVYMKSATAQFTVEQNEDLEVPVDGDLERGSNVFMASCAACHGLSATHNTAVGPSLALAYNRKVGSDASYRGYSRALLNNSLYWTSRNLFRFMEDPAAFIPGTTCKIGSGGLKSEEDRADLIEFLREFSKEMSLNLRVQEVKASGYSAAQSSPYVKEEIQKVKGARKSP
jgi:cytochrome c